MNQKSDSRLRRPYPEQNTHRSSSDLKKIRTNNPNPTTINFDFSRYELKPDADKKPLWIGDLREKKVRKNPGSSEIKSQEIGTDKEKVVNLILETFTPSYEQAKDFVTLIAQPISRQDYFHYYKINASSLNAAVTMGNTAEQIIENLYRFSKIKGFSSWHSRNSFFFLYNFAMVADWLLVRIFYNFASRSSALLLPT